MRILATIIDPPVYFADSTNSITTKNDSPYQLEYLLTLLNSTLFQWRFKLTSTNNNVATNELESMPFQTTDFSARDGSKHTSIPKDVLHRSSQGATELLSWVEGELKWTRDTGHSGEGCNGAVHDLLAYLAEQMINLHPRRAEIEQTWQEWVEATIPNQHKLTQQFLARGWAEIGCKDGWEGVKAEFQARNAIPSGKDLQRLRQETEEALSELCPLYERIRETDELVDQIVYRLYGLTEEEISVVETSVGRG